MNDAIPKEFEIWSCCHRRKCGWRGKESELKAVRNHDIRIPCWDRVCPKCNGDSFYILDSREMSPQRQKIKRKGNV